MQPQCAKSFILSLVQYLSFKDFVLHFDAEKLSFIRFAARNRTTVPKIDQPCKGVGVQHINNKKQQNRITVNNEINKKKSKLIKKKKTPQDIEN